MSAEEDQLTKIKNLLQTLTESQVHAEALGAMRHQEFLERQQETLERNARVDKEMAELRQNMDRHIELVATAAKTATAQEVTERQLQKFIADADVRFGKLEKKKP